MSKKLTAVKRGESGFTLIELLVVIIILGVLSAVVVFAVRGVGDKGAQAAYDTDEKTIRTAQEAYCAKFGRYASQDELVDGKFLSEAPQYHDTGAVADGTVNADGNCKGSGDLARSRFFIACSPSESGCGEGATLALGGTLVINIGTGAPAVDLNPAVQTAGGVHQNSEDMFNGLLRYEPNGDIGGDLAQTFSFNNNVPAASNPNCPGAVPACDPTTTVATFVLRPDVKFHGKDNTVLGDGQTLTPADVEFSFEKAILANHGRTRAINPTLGITGGGTSTVVPPEAIQTLPPTAGNGGTVIFNLRQVYTPLKYTLNVTEAPILSKTAYEPCFSNGSLFLTGASPPNCPANVSPVGTGPFRFSSLANDGVRTVKNPDYFRKDGSGRRLPYFDEVYKKVVLGRPGASLLSGDIDVATVDADERPLFTGNSNFELSPTPRGTGGGNCITTIAFNMTKRQAGDGTTAPAEPGGGYPADSPYYGQGKPNSNVNAPPHRTLGDGRVREAIFKALDRNKIWSESAFGAGRVADAPVHSIFQPNGAYQGPQPLPTFEADRSGAKALLEAAGWTITDPNTNAPYADGIRRAKDHPNANNPDAQLVVANGARLELQYLHATGSVVNDAIGIQIKDQLALVGIDVTVQTGDNSAIVAPRIFRARTYDMGQISYCNNDEPQFGVRRQYHTDALLKGSASFANSSGYKSTMMDQLWLDASKAADVATYQAKFLQIQRLALGLSTPGGPTPSALEIAQKLPHVQIYESANTRGTKAACTGFNNNNTGLYMEAASCRR